MIIKKNYAMFAIKLVAILMTNLMLGQAIAQEQVIELGDNLMPVTNLSLFIEKDKFIEIINDSSEGDTLSIGEDKKAAFDIIGLESKNHLIIEAYDEELIHSIADNSCVKIESADQKLSTMMRGNLCKTAFENKDFDDTVFSAGVGMTYKLNNRSKIVTSIFESMRYSDVENFSFGDRERTVLIQLKISLGR